eukprot:TRINITY_DN2098_c0_g1_i1.p2 TRINITY_DN2098_c0_g1~~TRINITY_DN2098_c0_g1_i1.p2  ORF type:complete len:298 (+),score=167.64 TRINITY_DN2098_c0_g1_i1:124-1017(+)
MIILEFHNRIVENTVREQVMSGGADIVDVTCADFDGVTFHVSSDPAAPGFLLVSISTRCFYALQEYGVNERLRAIYGELMQAEPESSYDATLRIDLAKAPKAPGFFRKIAMLKRHVLAAPLLDTFEKIEKKTAKPDLLEIRYRDDEAFYLKPEGDRCVMIFSIHFRDMDDVIFSKVFLQAYADERKNIRGSPAVSFSQKEPPLELQGLVQASEEQGYVQFVLFPDHLHPQRRQNTVNLMLTFRNHLMYHLKCTKAAIAHSMRERVKAIIVILNRAKQSFPGDAKEKKKFGGKTFVRK